MLLLGFLPFDCGCTSRRYLTHATTQPIRQQSSPQFNPLTHIVDFCAFLRLTER